MAFHFHSIFFYNIPMVDLNSLACMWVSHDVNLLGHKDRWGSQDWLWVLEDFVPGEFEKSLKLGLVFMVACCFEMEDFLILVILIWFGGKSGASWEYIMKFKVVCLLILFWCLMEEFVLSTSDSESPLTRSYSQRLMSDSVRYYLLWPFIFIAFFFYRFT